MASGREQADEYHPQFAELIIRALKEWTAPWQQAWQPGEHVLPLNFSSGHGYRGGNAVRPATTALDRGYADPRWGGWRQIRESGGSGQLLCGGRRRTGSTGGPPGWLRAQRAESGRPGLGAGRRRAPPWRVLATRTTGSSAGLRWAGRPTVNRRQSPSD